MIPSSTWRHFYRSLQNQSCILILGPHIATFQSEEGEQQLLSAFSQQLVAEMEMSNVNFDKNEAENLSYTALRWLKGRRLNDNMLREEMCDFYDNALSRVPSIYRALGELPFFLVINTSPEEYMQQAFLRAGKEAVALHYNYQRNQSALIPKMSVEKPVVYNLFGTIEEPESLVISKEDQIVFINNLLKNVSTLPKEILQYFDKDKTFLFLGFDANDWHLPLLFRSLRLHEEKEMSFYLHQDQIGPVQKDFYIDAFDFQFVAEESLEFARGLKDGYSKWLAENETKQKTEGRKESSHYIEKPQIGVSGKANMLMLTANPKNTSVLELNEEIDTVDEVHARASERSSFFFKPVLNIRKKRLLELLLRHKPQIVHFSGHGIGSDGLLFYGESGKADLVQGDELANLFKQFKEQISCVVLNACYSEAQAETIAQYIPNVIGSNNAIGDQLAIRFTEGFYTALFSGENYEQAFNMAMAHIGLQNFPPGGRPVFYKNGKKYQAE